MSQAAPVNISDLGANAIECQQLSNLLELAWEGRYDSNKLQQSLNKHRESLSNPLKHKIKDDASMRHIVNNRNNYSIAFGTTLTLSEQDLTLIHQFSEATNLDQRYSVILLENAKQQIRRERQQQQQLSFLNERQSGNEQIKSKIMENMKSIYFDSRIKRLKALRELIVVWDHITPSKEENKMQEDEDNVYPQELQNIINSAVGYIFSNNVISNISESLKQCLDLSKSNYKYCDEYQIEICDCIGVFYAMSQRTQCNVNDVTALLGLFEFFLLKDAFNESHRVRCCSYLLSLSLFQMMNPSHRKPYIDPRNNSKLDDNKILQSGDELKTSLNTMTNNLSTINKVTKAQRRSASFLLLIIVMVYKINEKETQTPNNFKYCPTALRHGALEGLYKDFLINEALFVELKGSKEAAYETLGDFICELFELCDKECRDHYSREKKSLQQQYGRKSKGLTTMLNILCDLAHHSENVCGLLIDRTANKSFIEYLDNEADLPTPWFPLYAKFIYELARVRPHDVYNQITQEKCEKLNIDAILQILEKTSQIYKPKQITRPIQSMNENINRSNYLDNLQPSYLNTSSSSQQTETVWQEPPIMNDQEINIVCSVLKVLEALALIQEVRNQLNANRNVPILPLLFSLMQCQLDQKVLAQTMSCISSFVRGDSDRANQVWEYMERDQILYTQRQKHQPITKGVELDIIEGEKAGSNATYAATVSICKLLKELLIATDLPQLLGQSSRGQQPPGVWPYTDYVRNFVFIRWAKREYKRDRERWELASTCLEIFDALLDKFDPLNLSPHSNIKFLFKTFPSFELLTELLAPHSSLIEVILDIYQKAFIIIEEKQEMGDDTMFHVRCAMKNSLKLVQKAIENEEKFLNICQKYWPQRLSLRPLNSTLLSQQYRNQIVSFAKCVQQTDNMPDIDVATYSLSILSHLNKTQQGVTLRSVFADNKIQILQESFSRQLRKSLKRTQQEEKIADIRVSIIEFLLKSIKATGHNLGLMLLGFHEQSASRDQLQSDISCLNAILNISLDSDFCRDSDALAEGCFELLYRLLSNGRIGERFLNAAEAICPSFFVRLLRQNIICTSPPSNHVQSTNLITCYLNQRAWLLRAISFEFHLVCTFAKSGILNVQDVKYLGFHRPSDDQKSKEDIKQYPIYQIFEQLDVDIDTNNRLDSIPMIWGVPLDQFKQYPNPQNDATFTWNIEKMHNTLLRAPATMAARDKLAHLGQLSEEALVHNLRVSLMSAIERAYDSWAELIRCVLGNKNKIVNYNSINNGLLLSLLDGILQRLSVQIYGPRWARVSNTMSQVALNIMFFFRHSLGGENPVQIDINGCRTILEGMINSILTQKDVRNPRANLYSCLSNYLHYCKFKPPNVLSDIDESKAINLDEKITTEKDKLNMYNVAALLSRRDELLEIIFEDCVSKDSYLSSISSLVLQDLLSSNENVSWEESNIASPQKWLSMMLERSRLLFVLKATCDLDQDIQKALASQRHWHFLYQFESMMDVLISASVYRNGTMELIDNNCISQHLSQLKCLKSRVFWTTYSSSSFSNNNRLNTNNNNNNIRDDNNNNLSMECSRYLQLLTPCLRLINSMFAACPKNIRLHYQTLTFFQKHNDIIDKLLTLDNNEFVVLRSVKLILSIWYQLYYGPLYIGNPNQLSSISARDSTILEHIEAKLPYFYFLIKKFKDIAFKQEYFQNDIDNDFDDDMMHNTSMYNETIYCQTKGETKETVSREIIRILINIFRLKSIGSSLSNNNNRNLSSSNNKIGLQINPIFGKDLNTNQRQPELAPNLKLLCDCLKGILPISKQTGKWIYEQNEELRRVSSNDNASILAKLQAIEPILSTVSTDVNLQCFLIENILVLLYFHCKHYLDVSSSSLATDFYHNFSSVVMSEVIVGLKEWYQDENTCILHVDQDMMEKKWSSGIPIPSTSKRFIEMMIHKFHDLQRDKASGPLSITN